MKKDLWDRLVPAAEREVADLIRGLPSDVRGAVSGIPVVFEPAPSRALVADGVDPGLLGLFLGDPLAVEGENPMPRKILLFVRNLWEDAGYDLDEYLEQVRTTYLHEIGHALGLEEGDLEERGLE
jgi:predicted Zn-dependent protease with MMP-like domain